MSINDEKLAVCALNKIFGYHPRFALKLIEEAGDPLEIFSRAPFDENGASGAAHGELLAQLTPDALEWAQRELAKVKEEGYRFVSYLDEDYPEALLECEDHPLGFYLRSDSPPTQIFSMRPMIGIVGTRDVSPYGRQWCISIVKALSQAPVAPAIVSGLALGTDGIAHETALECGLPSIGVMATGIDDVYPWQHRKLAGTMASGPGSALVTDYPMNTSPVALNFVRRNRIIAALSRAVIVVESKTKGGSLMTAKYACDYAREVYALPGRLGDIRSAGCNSLIFNHMAQIITSPEELVEELGLTASRRRFRTSVTDAPKGVGSGAHVIDKVSAPKKDRGDDPFLEAIESRYGKGSALALTAAAVRDNMGLDIEQLSKIMGKPYRRVLEDICLLEVDGIVTTDIMRRCSLSATWL